MLGSLLPKKKGTGAVTARSHLPCTAVPWDSVLATTVPLPARGRKVAFRPEGVLGQKRTSIKESSLKTKPGSSLVAQWVKDPVLPVLGCGFEPWPGDFYSGKHVLKLDGGDCGTTLHT